MTWPGRVPKPAGATSNDKPGDRPRQACGRKRRSEPSPKPALLKRAEADCARPLFFELSAAAAAGRFMTVGGFKGGSSNSSVLSLAGEAMAA
eukprot:103340-Alexandrium_andersonii.AAC.1